MHWLGLVIGGCTFVIIGVFHPIVIKAQYYFGKGCWPIFLLFGAICLGAAIIISTLWLSSLVAILGFTFLWSINELFEQEERVKRGRFPANPHRVGLKNDNEPNDGKSNNHKK